MNYFLYFVVLFLGNKFVTPMEGVCINGMSYKATNDRMNIFKCNKKLGDEQWQK